MNGRADMFGVQIDALSMSEAVGRLLDWVVQGGPCRYVVTPNVDHAVVLQEHEGLRRAYAQAALVLADGIPVVMASRLLGTPLPERVAGSDLVPGLFDACGERGGLRVFLMGGAPGVADRAASNIRRRWPAVQVVGTASPPLGFEKDENLNASLLADIGRAHPDVLLVCLGSPKQELWVHQHHGSIGATVTLCVGATIDFLAGHQARAPRWMRRAGLEWCYRLVCEPRRLWRRYARDAWIFPRLVWREWARSSVRPR